MIREFETMNLVAKKKSGIKKIERIEYTDQNVVILGEKQLEIWNVKSNSSRTLANNFAGDFAIDDNSVLMIDDT